MDLPASLRRNPTAIKLNRRAEALASRNKSLQKKVKNQPGAIRRSLAFQGGAFGGGFLDELQPFDFGPFDAPTWVGVLGITGGWWFDMPDIVNFGNGVMAPQTADLGRAVAMKLKGGASEADTE